MNVNKVVLIGRLGKDPEVRFTAGGQAVASFSLATSKHWKDKDGQKHEKTEWHKVVVWGKLGEACGKYLEKGRPAYVEGELATRSWTDKQGVERYMTEIIAQTVQFLGDNKEEKKGAYAPEKPKQEPQQEPYQSTFTEDDIPF